jgi:hypothetical protein
MYIYATIELNHFFFWKLCQTLKGPLNWLITWHEVYWEWQNYIDGGDDMDTSVNGRKISSMQVL